MIYLVSPLLTDVEYLSVPGGGGGGLTILKAEMTKIAFHNITVSLSIFFHFGTNQLPGESGTHEKIAACLQDI